MVVECGFLNVELCYQKAEKNVADCLRQMNIQMTRKASSLKRGDDEHTIDKPKRMLDTWQHSFIAIAENK